jgi:hypothetical protein
MLVGLSVVMPWLLEVGMPKVMPTVGAKFGMPGGTKFWGQFGTRVGVLGWVSSCAVTETPDKDVMHKEFCNTPNQ